MYNDLCLHVDSAAPETLQLLLANAANYYKDLPDGDASRLEVVANGPAVTLFTDAHKDLRDKAEPLMARGMRVKLCANAIAGFGVDRERLWPGCEIVPGGVFELIRLQREGFAYIKP